MRVFCIWLFLFCVNVTVFPQNERFKSLFVYNFTKNIEWPASYRQSDFVITVLGNSTIYNELQQNVKGKRTGNQTIQVTQAASISSIGRCNILYIPSQQSNLLEAAEKQFSGIPTVVITEKNGMMHQGADINIIQLDGKLQFEINAKRLESKKLSAAKSLLSLGISYDSGNMRKAPQLESVDDISTPR
ncbi:MAG: YfiR family protein [Bacteroidales bacterium]|jgi:hypothetical protein|nr:YfiR family protein [Bacteroidales bacterium]